MTAAPRDLAAIVGDRQPQILDWFRRGFVEAARALQSETLVDRAMFTRFCDRRDALIDDLSARAIASAPARFKRVVACQEGCAHCCKQHVIVSSTEVLRIAIAASDPAHMREAVASGAASVAGLSHHDRYGIACPLLADNRCTIYATRPQECRTHFSLSRRACAYDETSPNLVEPKMAGEILFMAFDYALMRCTEGPLQMVQGELSHLLEAALAPGAFESWAEGGRVFPENPFHPHAFADLRYRPYAETLREAASFSGADGLIEVVRRVP